MSASSHTISICGIFHVTFPGFLQVLLMWVKSLVKPLVQQYTWDAGFSMVVMTDGYVDPAVGEEVGWPYAANAAVNADWVINTSWAEVASATAVAMNVNGVVKKELLTVLPRYSRERYVDIYGGLSNEMWGGIVLVLVYLCLSLYGIVVPSCLRGHFSFVIFIRKMEMGEKVGQGEICG